MQHISIAVHQDNLKVVGATSRVLTAKLTHQGSASEKIPVTIVFLSTLIQMV
jgi:hypothetical protein